MIILSAMIPNLSSCLTKGYIPPIDLLTDSSTDVPHFLSPCLRCLKCLTVRHPKYLCILTKRVQHKDASKVGGVFLEFITYNKRMPLKSKQTLMVRFFNSCPSHLFHNSSAMLVPPNTCPILPFSNSRYLRIFTNRDIKTIFFQTFWILQFSSETN